MIFFFARTQAPTQFWTLGRVFGKFVTGRRAGLGSHQPLLAAPPWLLTREPQNVQKRSACLSLAGAGQATTQSKNSNVTFEDQNLLRGLRLQTIHQSLATRKRRKTRNPVECFYFIGRTLGEWTEYYNPNIELIQIRLLFTL